MTGIISVETVKENEDGSADYTFHFDSYARGVLAEEGLKLVLYCAAAKIDMQGQRTKAGSHNFEKHRLGNGQGQMGVSVNQMPPYSLSIKDAAMHFGLATQTFYNYISTGKLHRGIHYLKVGKKVVILRDKFIEFMREEDGSQSRKENNQVVH